VSQTNFEWSAGFATARKVVSSSYDYVDDDEFMAPYFEGIDMRP
jgi:hypothetical protein